MMANHINSTQSILMDSLSSLSSSHLSHLSQSLSALSRRHLRRLVSLLSSPILFSLTLRHLQSLSLHHKSLLIARHLLSNLTFFKHLIRNPTSSVREAADTEADVLASASALPSAASRMKLKDLDAVLLLLLLCELHQHDPDPGFYNTPLSCWRSALSEYASSSILRVSSFGEESLVQFIECIRRCWDLVNVMGCDEGRGEAAASAAAVVALPSVEVVGGGEECAICKEEMKKGRDVCELPCKHLFHWVCILRWLKKRHTCPCCRHRLPTDDLRCEIRRLLEELALIGGGGGLHQECL